jgi:hypothetical protein
LVQACPEGTAPTQVASARFRERSPTSRVFRFRIRALVGILLGRPSLGSGAMPFAYFLAFP